ncbi:hypothetical protein COLO4_29528 [Corchorus olitorius]|uniref:Uncharacterized protein n=1 Tax=Corchorus olitorius TaxID=93759 RepID=A0A1R3HE56_9ROSI|nr:hypothetical protein COLO4_29528 [Corchorus olitorius]
MALIPVPSQHSEIPSGWRKGNGTGILGWLQILMPPYPPPSLWNRSDGKFQPLVEHWNTTSNSVVGRSVAGYWVEWSTTSTILLFAVERGQVVHGGVIVAFNGCRLIAGVYWGEVPEGVHAAQVIQSPSVRILIYAIIGVLRAIGYV